MACKLRILYAVVRDTLGVLNNLILGVLFPSVTDGEAKPLYANRHVLKIDVPPSPFKAQL